MASRRYVARGRTPLRPENLARLSLWNVVAAYDKHRHKWNKKMQAGVAFALAMALKREADRMGEGFRDAKDDYMARAKGYAEECLAILKELPSSRLEDVSVPFVALAGVTFPNYFYLEYVKRFLRNAGFRL